MLAFIGKNPAHYPSWPVVVRWAIKTAMVRLTIDTLKLPFLEDHLDIIRIGTDLPPDWYVCIADAGYYGAYHRMTRGHSEDDSEGVLRMTLEIGGMLLIVVYAPTLFARQLISRLHPAVFDAGALLMYPDMVRPK